MALPNTKALPVIQVPKHAFFPTTLRGRLLALAAVAALPAVIVAIAGVALYRDRLTDHLEQRLSHETQRAAASVGMVLAPHGRADRDR